MTHTLSSPSRGREIARGMGALIALLVLVIVVPAVLLVLAPPFLPSMPASRESLWHALRTADDASLLVAVVTLVAWAGWAVLTGTLAVEVVCVTRGVPTPRLPALGSPQRLASQLVASVVVLLSAPATPSMATPVAPAHVAAPILRSAPEVSVPQPESVREPAVVRAGDHVDPDRRAKRQEYPTVVVERHDTLWGLAERHLGSGLRYTDIVRLNRGVTQPDGRALHDPSWIYPGWILRLPHDATGAGVRQPAARTRPRPHDPAPIPAPPDWVDRGPARSTPSRVGTAAGVGVDRADPAGRPPMPEPSAIDPVVYGAQGLAGADEPLPPTLALGLGALTVAGVIAEITRQRRRFQRRRHAGEVPAQPSVASGAAERELRAVDSTSVPRRLRAGLALLADGCADSGRALPRVELIRVSTDELELVVAVDEEPVPPYGWRTDRVWVWGGEANEPVPRADRLDPCPGLVTVGTDGPYQVLVNLEAAGTLHVAGDDGPQDEEVRDVGAAIALDLRGRVATGALSVSWVEDPDEDAGTARRAEVAALLADSEVGDVHEARAAGVAEDAWAPEVSIGPGAGAALPWSGSASVVLGDTSPGGWALTRDRGLWQLTPSGVEVTPQRLTPKAKSLVEELVRQVPLASRTVSRDHDLRGLLLADESVHELAERLTALLADHGGPTHAGSAEGPRILLLGPVRVSGVDDSVIPGRVQRATELAAYLATHPGVGRHQLDEAMWPGRRIERATRNPFVSRTRQWLGRRTDGHPYLPLVADGGEYRLSADVGCDWYDLRREAPHALAHIDDPDELQRVLELVQGRPFSAVSDKAYGWADALTQRMVALLVDLFHLLACRRLEFGDLPAAAEAAARGLSIEPVSELLHRDAIAVAHLAGDPEALARATARLERSAQVLDLGDDLEPDTVELLHRVRAV